MKTICINAGHTVRGAGTGANGHINEAEEARKVVAYLAEFLRKKGYSVVVANIDRAASQDEYLKGVVKMANDAAADLFVSIHFNAGGGKGHEVFTWKGAKTAAARGICARLERLGFTNRGIKDGRKLYVIRKTKMEALLVEVCFVDTQTDCALYRKLGEKIIAQAIGRGIDN